MVAPDRDRLRRAFRVAGGGAAEPAGGPSADLRTFLQQRADRFRAPPRPIVDLPPGAEVRGPHGVFWRRELRYPREHVHGSAPLAAAWRLDGPRLAALAKDRAFADLDPMRCLFVDTETTGLAGGAGTIVFAYGLGFLDEQELVLEQLFLRDFGEEPALLRHVAARLAERPVQVTFVGKSYDRHRIAARMAVHKVRAPVLTAPHLDLYHLTRRAHGGSLPNARLGTVEAHLLGLARDDDLPGSEAPAAFLDWIRDRTGPVDRVLEHNRLDVLSLVALLGRLAGRINRADGGSEPEPAARDRSRAR
ncbi:MAG: ribonuclease H-like domain-containing protein [Planctomycetes bacterium]|nr:ribonuclease H-like domain-containing protein [Planctomycetota bacterium]